MRHIGLYRISLGVIAGFFVFSAIAETTLERIKRRSSVVIGYRDASIPFSYAYQDKPFGYSVDLCKMIISGISKNLQRDLKIEYQAVSSSNRINAVVDGKIDMECGSTTNNLERRQKVAFSIPHYIASTRIMVRNDSPYAKKGANIHLAKITTTRGSTSEKLMEKLNYKVDPMLLAQEHKVAFSLLESGKADAFMMDDIILAGLRSESDNPDKYVILDTSYWVEALAIMLPKNDPEFKGMVDDELKKIIVDGRIYSIYKNWFENPIPPKNVNLKWPMTGLLKNSMKYPSDWAPDF